MLGIRRNSLSYKTSIIYVILGVIIISIFNFVIWENQSELIIENQKLVLESKSTRLREIVHAKSFSFDENDNKDFVDIANNAFDENVSRTLVFSEGGDTYYDFNPNNMATPVYEDELVLINRAIARFELENKQFLHKTDVAHGILNLYVPARFESRNEMLVFKFVLPLLQLTEKKDEVLKICIFIAITVCLLQVIMGVWLRRLIISPISNLVQITIGVSKGKFRQEITINQNDEIGLLASAFNEMTINLEQMQEEAKGANPLSGLPGNLAIMSNIDKRLKLNEDIAIIYGDLDNFKAYNDKYGLTKGDEAILHCKECFLNAAKRAGKPDTFIGHEGGDDFVLVTSFDTWEALCKIICRLFDEGIKRFYNESDFKQGFIDSMDRQGNRMRFPLMSISLAVVSNHFRSAQDHRILLAWAAEMKKVAKKMEGSSYAIDKRRS